jgi:hypothetical protein
MRHQAGEEEENRTRSLSLAGLSADLHYEDKDPEAILKAYYALAVFFQEGQ